MKKITSSIVPKGQITIPIEVHRRWGLGPKDEVRFVIENDEVRLFPVRFTVRSTAGSVAALRSPLDWQEVERIVQDERATDVIRKMRRPPGISRQPS